MIRIRELINDYEERLVKDKLSLYGHHIYGIFYNTEKEKNFVQRYGNSILDLFIMKNSPYKSFGEYRKEMRFLGFYNITTEGLYKYPLLYCNEREFMIIFQDYLNKLFENESKNKNKNDFKEIIL